MREQDMIRTMPIVDYVAATSVGIVEGMPMLDLAYTEDSKADVDMNVIKTGAGLYIELQTGNGPKRCRSARGAQPPARPRRHGIRQLIALQRGHVGSMLGK